MCAIFSSSCSTIRTCDSCNSRRSTHECLSILFTVCQRFRKPTHPISSSRKALISITLPFLICRQTMLTRNAWDRKSCNYTWSYKRYKDTKREVTQSHAMKTETFEVISFKLKQDFQFKRLYLHFLFLELWLHRYKRVYSFYMHSNDIILKRGNEKINK